MWQFFTMPLVAIFYCATCCNFELLLTIIMDDGDQYFEIFFYVQKSSKCHVLDFNKKMTINDISMTPWV